MGIRNGNFIHIVKKTGTGAPQSVQPVLLSKPLPPLLVELLSKLENGMMTAAAQAAGKSIFNPVEISLSQSEEDVLVAALTRYPGRKSNRAFTEVGTAVFRLPNPSGQSGETRALLLFDLVGPNGKPQAIIWNGDTLDWDSPLLGNGIAHLAILDSITPGNGGMLRIRCTPPIFGSDAPVFDAGLLLTSIMEQLRMMLLDSVNR